MMTGNIAKRWKLLSGHEDNWKSLLEPLDIDLRQYLIHYGERAQATYDNFNFEHASPFAGSCRYSMKNLFPCVGLEIANPFKYEPTKYFYATSQIEAPPTFILKPTGKQAWSRESNWFGYVAVTNDAGKAALGRRDILIAWRGTLQGSELLKDFECPLVSGSQIFGDAGDPKLHSGFLSVYTSFDPRSQYNKTSAREQIICEVERLLNQFKDEEISITVAGHGLGAALATINAADIAQGLNKKPKHHPTMPSPHVTAFLFGCPRAGDTNFRNLLLSMKNLHLLKIRNIPDVVPFLPVFAEFVDVGEELLIDTTQSKFLNPGDIATWHSLEGYLHGIAGTQGMKGGFHLEVKRDIALVNKMWALLKAEFSIPPLWWSEKNKGMVQLQDGSWKLQDHQEDA